MLLRTVHHTRFEYPHPAVDSHNEVRLQPLADHLQRLVEFKLTISPTARVFHYGIPGGEVHHFSVLGPHHVLDIVAEAHVETRLANPYQDLNLLLDDWEVYDDPAFRQQYVEFLAVSPYVCAHPACREIAERVRKRSGTGVANFLIELSAELNQSFAYDPDATHVHSKLSDVIDGKAGVCQDFAHLMIGCCRSVGIPARYVSGFLYVAKSESHLRGDHATHAWVEAMLPNGSWLGLDPTNKVLANDHHVRIHTGRDYSEVTPTRGVYRGVPASVLTVTVDVERLDTPR